MSKKSYLEIKILGDYDKMQFLTGEGDPSQMSVTDFFTPFPFIEMFKCGYSPYRHSALFGFFFKVSQNRALDTITMFQAWFEQFLLNFSNIFLNLIWNYKEFINSMFFINTIKQKKI